MRVVLIRRYHELNPILGDNLYDLITQWVPSEIN